MFYVFHGHYFLTVNRGPPLAGYPRLITQYSRSNPPHLEPAAAPFRNHAMLHTMVRGGTFNKRIQNVR